MPYVTKKLIADGWLAKLLIVGWITCLLLAYGCAAPLTEEEQFEREHQRAMDMENWILCEKIYRQAGKPTFHDGHTHQHGRVRPEDVKQDLWTNQCRRILDEYWAE